MKFTDFDQPRYYEEGNSKILIDDSIANRMVTHSQALGASYTGSCRGIITKSIPRGGGRNAHMELTERDTESKSDLEKSLLPNSELRKFIKTQGNSYSRATN